MKNDLTGLFRRHGIQPSAHRVAVATYILATDEHPSADQVWAHVKRKFPYISRATVYNTLNLFQNKGLIKGLVLSEGKVVFDPKTDLHHHFVDESTGKIYDVPWETLKVSNVEGLRGFEVSHYQVVLRGRKTK